MTEKVMEKSWEFNDQKVWEHVQTVALFKAFYVRHL